MRWLAYYYVGSVLAGLPFFLRWDREARQDGVSLVRRAPGWLALLAAAPFGYGLWMALRHRPRRRGA